MNKPYHGWEYGKRGMQMWVNINYTSASLKHLAETRIVFDTEYTCILNMAGAACPIIYLKFKLYIYVCVCIYIYIYIR